MFYVHYLRQEAQHYRDLAAKAKDPKTHDECEDLAEVLEEVAVEVEDKESAG